MNKHAGNAQKQPDMKFSVADMRCGDCIVRLKRRAQPLGRPPELRGFLKAVLSKTVALHRNDIPKCTSCGGTRSSFD